MASIRVERRLAAIVAADIVGYSHLIEVNEAETLATIRTLRRDVINPLLTEHGGRLVKLMGDGALVEFGSVVDAVVCSVAIQKTVADQQAEIRPERRIIFRIGINLGDVVVEGDDLLGDGVNIAARLEALSEPGGIYIADTVQRQLSGKTNLAFEDVGERSLKNIEVPVRVWRWTRDSAPTPVRAPLSPPDKPSIAVLPFTNMSGDPEQEFFSDGITEDIITELSRYKSLFVVARNS
jgi:class 3 adenylate cyclase